VRFGLEEDRTWQQGTVEHGIIEHKGFPLAESLADVFHTQHPRISIIGAEPQGIVHGMHAAQVTLLAFVVKGGHIRKRILQFQVHEYRSKDKG
jgi:hypothetical protein